MSSPSNANETTSDRTPAATAAQNRIPWYGWLIFVLFETISIAGFVWGTYEYNHLHGDGVYLIPAVTGFIGIGVGVAGLGGAKS